MKTFLPALHIEKTNLILIVNKIAEKTFLTESTAFDFQLAIHYRQAHHCRNFGKYEF